MDGINKYQRLFNAISDTNGTALQSDMDEIIRIVHEDFPNQHPTPQVQPLDDETAAEPIQNALHATGRHTTDQCDVLTEGILQYIKDYGFVIAKQHPTPQVQPATDWRQMFFAEVQLNHNLLKSKSRSFYVAASEIIAQLKIENQQLKQANATLQSQLQQPQVQGSEEKP